MSDSLRITYTQHAVVCIRYIILLYVEPAEKFILLFFFSFVFSPNHMGSSNPRIPTLPTTLYDYLLELIVYPFSSNDTPADAYIFHVHVVKTTTCFRREVS